MIKYFKDLKIGDVIYDIIGDNFYKNTIIKVIDHPTYFDFHLKDQNDHVWSIGISKIINRSIYYLTSSHILIADKKIFYDLCKNDFVI